MRDPDGSDQSRGTQGVCGKVGAGKGKDPISGYRELQKQKYREEAEKKVKLDEEEKQKKWYEDDTKDFLDKYSQEKLQELSKDEDFNLFASGKIGKVPLANIYEDYQKLISKYQKKIC